MSSIVSTESVGTCSYKDPLMTNLTNLFGLISLIHSLYYELVNSVFVLEDVLQARKLGWSEEK